MLFLTFIYPVVFHIPRRTTEAASAVIEVLVNAKNKRNNILNDSSVEKSQSIGNYKKR
jgi:hypothetical protein